MTILQKIIQHKKVEISQRKKAIPEKKLLERPEFSVACKPFGQSITELRQFGIIAEFKRKSPSKELIWDGESCRFICEEYGKNGAAAMSILTDKLFFGGDTEDLADAKKVATIPLLRKEFIIDTYQILEAKSLGADAILLIASVLSRKEVKQLAELAVQCGMEVLLEIHEKEEMGHYTECIRCIGVNNRNLSTFQTDTRVSTSVFPYLPSDAVKISESGLHDAKTVAHLCRLGYQGFLIGESLLKTGQPGKTLASFIDEVNTILC